MGRPIFVAREGVWRALEGLGPHPARTLGIDLEEASGRAQWLVAARLFSERDPSPRIEEAFRRLATELGAQPSALHRAGPERVATWLAEAQLKRAEIAAVGLCRMGRSLEDLHAGDLEALASGSEDLEELGGRLAGLASGFGRAAVLRFLRPLREPWSAARETPLHDTARAAAVHLGLLAEGDDWEGESATLSAACRDSLPELDAIDAEAALERLGARSCRTSRGARCPLGDLCPIR